MDKIAGLCRVLSFRKKAMRNKKSKMTQNVVGQSAAEAMIEEIANAIPECERLLLEKEQLTGLQTVAFLDWCYGIKRFSFNGTVINDQVFETICPDLGLKWEDVNNEAEQTTAFVNFKNKHLYSDGTWDIEPILQLGFLLCAHPSREDQREEFWQLVNPDLNEKCTLERVLAFLTSFVVLSIDMRYTIEVQGGSPNNLVCDYLKRVSPDVNREDLAANLVGFPSAE